MSIDINGIKNDIRSAMSRYTGIQIEDDSKNLFSNDYHPIIPNYLYVIKAIEEKYGTVVYRVIETSDFSIFTVNQLSEAIARALMGNNEL